MPEVKETEQEIDSLGDEPLPDEPTVGDKENKEKDEAPAEKSRRSTRRDRGPKTR